MDMCHSFEPRKPAWSFYAEMAAIVRNEFLYMSLILDSSLSQSALSDGQRSSSMPEEQWERMTTYYLEGWTRNLSTGSGSPFSALRIWCLEKSLVTIPTSCPSPAPWDLSSQSWNAVHFPSSDLKQYSDRLCLHIPTILDSLVGGPSQHQ